MGNSKHIKSAGPGGTVGLDGEENCFQNQTPGFWLGLVIRCATSPCPVNQPSLTLCSWDPAMLPFPWSLRYFLLL